MSTSNAQTPVRSTLEAVSAGRRSLTRARVVAASLVGLVVVAIFAVYAGIVIWLVIRPIKNFTRVVAIGAVGGLLTAFWFLPLAALVISARAWVSGLALASVVGTLMVLPDGNSAMSEDMAIPMALTGVVLAAVLLTALPAWLDRLRVPAAHGPEAARVPGPAVVFAPR